MLGQVTPRVGLAGSGAKAVGWGQMLRPSGNGPFKMATEQDSLPQCEELEAYVHTTHLSAPLHLTLLSQR